MEVLGPTCGRAEVSKQHGKSQGTTEQARGVWGLQLPRDVQEEEVMEGGHIQCSPPQRPRGSWLPPGVGVDNLSVPRWPTGA